MHITNQISQLFYKFANTQFSPSIQNIINNGYVKLLGLDMSEFKNPTEYKSLNELFTRELIIQRDYDTTEDTFISPTDSFVTAIGDIKQDISLQIKGMYYNISDLLTNHCNIKERNLLNGKFANFYLSPKDYHRYHLPFNCQINKLIHIPGKLYPVNFRYLNKKSNLFLENERVVLECQTSNNKYFYMVFVGALNVGKMVFTFEPNIETNNEENQNIKVYEYNDLHLKKGDCLGYFKMGSTVLIFWEKDFIELENIENTKIRFGETIAKIK